MQQNILSPSLRGRAGESLPTKKVYNSIDIAKFVAALIVVAVHTHPFGGTEFDYYANCLGRIAVPFFFVATSYFFFRREQPDIVAYTKRLGTLYGLWLLIMSPNVFQRFFIDYEGTLWLQIRHFLHCLFFGATWWSSWYIMACIIGVNIVYYLSRRWRWSNAQLLVLGFVGFVICLLTSGYTEVGRWLMPTPEWEDIHHKMSIKYYIFPSNSFIVSILYITMGKIFAESDWQSWSVFRSRRGELAIIIATVALGMVEVHLMRWASYKDDVWLWLPLFTLVNFGLLLQTEVKLNPDLGRWLRNLSILIYILHPFCARYVNPTLFGHKALDLWQFSVSLTESLVVAMLIVWLSGKISFLKKLY